MADEDDTDKPHEPTPKKLEDARKKGEFARSTDLTIMAAYGGFLLACVSLAPWGLQHMGTELAGLITNAAFMSEDLLQGESSAHLGRVMAQVAYGALPLFLVPGLLALASVLAQRSLVFTPSKLQPKISRISILSNAKQKFGASGLFEFLKSAVKLALYCIILALVLIQGAPVLIALAGLEPQGVVLSWFEMTRQFVAKVLAVAVVIGVIDYMFQHANHLRKNRMSFKELQDEVKAAEGDPQMRQQRRQKGYEIAMSQMMADVPSADVVVVNPTHYAVALKWDRLSGQAPICVAKGVDHIAAAIREKAMEAGVPIHHDPPTARALHASLNVGDEVQPDHYKPVAAAIRFAESLRKMKARS